MANLDSGGSAVRKKNPQAVAADVLDAVRKMQKAESGVRNAESGSAAAQRTANAVISAGTVMNAEAASAARKSMNLVPLPKWSELKEKSLLPVQMERAQKAQTLAALEDFRKKNPFWEVQLQRQKEAAADLAFEQSWKPQAGRSYSQTEKQRLETKRDALWDEIDRVGKILTLHEHDRDYSGTEFSSEAQARSQFKTLKNQYEDLDSQLEEGKNAFYYQAQTDKAALYGKEAVQDPGYRALVDKGMEAVKAGTASGSAFTGGYKTGDVKNKVEFAISHGEDLQNNPAMKMEFSALYGAGSAYNPGRYSYMTTDERRRYAYYLEKDPDKAEEYLDALDPKLNWKQAQDVMKTVEQRSKENKLGGVLTNLSMAFATPEAYFKTMGQQVKNTVTGEYQPVDPYASSMRGPLVAEASQKGVTGDIESPFWKFLADTGLSIGQNAVTLPFGPQLSLFIMSSGAAGSTASDALRRGATTEQAAALGTVAGVVEYATEKLPTEQLFEIFRGGKKSITQALMGVLKQAGTEGVEEIISEYADRAADNAIMGNKAEMEQYIRGLTAQGMSRDEAEKHAKVEFLVKQPLLSFAGGAISGGVMGGTATLGANVRAGVESHSASASAARADTSVNAAYDALQKTGLFSDEAGQALLRAQTDVKNARSRNGSGFAPDLRKIVLPGNEKAARQGAEEMGTAGGQQPAVQYSLTPYTEHQKENWANSKSIVVYEDQAQFEGFVEEAIQSKGTSGKKIYFGVVPDNLAQRVFVETGVDISGLNCTLRADEIQKILNDHGSMATENPRGQRQVTEQDIMRIPEVLQSPDHIVNGGSNEQGKPVIRFIKNENGKITVVSYVSDKHNDLTVKTMYAGLPETKKGSLATTAHDSMNESLASTSKTVRGTASINSILNSAEKINYKAPFGVDAIEWGRRTRKAAGAANELERSAAFYDVETDTVQSVSQLARDTGAKVVFDGTLKPGVEGYYADGVIHMNPKADSATTVFSHELTHHLESTESYGKLRELVLSRLNEAGGLEELRRSKLAEYRRQGVQLDADGIDAELVAEHVSRNLFTDEAEIRRVASYDLSLAGRIRSFLSRMAAKVTGNREKEFLLNAERLYARAIREAEQRQGSGSGQFSVEKKGGLWYDRTNGGGADGTEIRDAGGRDRGAVPGAGGQSAEGDGNLRGAQEAGERTGGTRGDNTSLRSTDSEGRGIKKEIAERLRGTAITDDAGNPVAVYHSTQNMEFTTFAEGDVGFHFGSLAQAQDRARQKGGDAPSRMIRGYLNIQNPVHVSMDIMSWKAEGTAMKMYADGVISREEYSSVSKLYSQGQDYKSPASAKLREILKAKGFDGIIYENGYEGEGISYIAFYPEQVVQDTEEKRRYSLKGDEDGEKKISQVRENTFEHSPTIFEKADLAAKEMAKSGFQYDVKTEQASMNEAQSRLEADYDGEVERLPNMDAWGSSDLDAAMEILRRKNVEARESGEYSAVGEWAKLIQEKGTNAGQMIQAFAKYTRTPEGVLTTAARNLQKLVDSGKMETDTMNDVLQDMAEFTETLDAVQDENTGALVDLIVKQAKKRNTKVSKGTLKRLLAEPDFHYLYDFALTQMENIAADYEPVSLGRKISTYQTMSHLLNFRTGMRNVVSNQVFDIVDAAANDVSLVPDAIMSVFTGRRSVGFEKSWLSKAKRQGAAQGLRRGALEISLDVQPHSSDGKSKYGTGGRRTWKANSKNPLGRAMSGLEKVMGYELNVTDEFHKGSVSAETLESLMPFVEKGDITLEYAQKAAEQEALYRSFQDNTTPGAVLAGLKDTLNLVGFGDSGRTLKGLKIKEFGLGDIVQKYTQVPGALISRSVEFSPTGYIKVIVALAQAQKNGGLKANPELQRKAALSIGRATTGTGLITAFAVLAASGLLRRAEDEEDKNIAALNAAEGIGGTQLNVSGIARWMSGEGAEWQTGDVTIDLNFMEPLNALMTLGAMIAQDESEKGFGGKLADNTLESLFLAIKDTPTMQTMDSIYNTIQYHDEETDLPVWAEIPVTIGESGVTGFVPSLIRQAAQATDQNYRDQYSTKDQLRQIGDKIKNTIPGARQTLPAKLDNFGEEKTYSNPWLNALNATLFPGNMMIYKQGGISKELQAVRDETDRADIYPERNAPYSVKFGAEKLDLTPEERQTFQKTRGGMANTLMADLVQSEEYRAAGADRKADLLANAIDFANDLAKRELAEARGISYGTKTWNKTIEALENGIAFGDYRSWVMDATGKKSDEKRLLLESRAMPDDTKQALYELDISDSHGERIDALLDAGLKFNDFLKVQDTYSLYNAEEGLKASERAVEFSRWVDEQGFTKEQGKAIRDHFKYYSMAAVDDTKYDKLTAVGLDEKAAYELDAVLSTLEPEQGKQSVSNNQKYQAIAKADCSEEDKKKALSAIMEESAYGKLEQAVGVGISIDTYTGYLYATSGMAADRDADDKAIGGSKRLKVLTYIDNLDLTNDQKDELYRLAGYAESKIWDVPWHGGESYQGNLGAKSYSGGSRKRTTGSSSRAVSAGQKVRTGWTSVKTIGRNGMLPKFSELYGSASVGKVRSPGALNMTLPTVKRITPSAGRTQEAKKIIMPHERGRIESRALANTPDGKLKKI